jgi:hypothetical protein
LLLGTRKEKSGHQKGILVDLHLYLFNESYIHITKLFDLLFFYKEQGQLEVGGCLLHGLQNLQQQGISATLSRFRYVYGVASPRAILA